MARTQDAGAALAAHRFGLGAPTLEGIGADPRAWLLAQIGPADSPWGVSLPTALDGLRLQRAFYRERRNTRVDDAKPAEQQFAEHFRATVDADVQSRLLTAVQSQRPFNERLTLFWANHFTVSMAKAPVRGLVGAFEREAIRPHVGGSFEAMLKAAVTHAAMLRYLDNAASAGPNSRLALRRSRRAVPAEGEMRAARVTGLNENLAREVLELHTLGVQGGYSQSDVTALAAVLTGWRVADPQRLDDKDVSASYFDPSWHEPGSKTVLGKRYAEGPQALDQVLRDLTLHPSTARFVATKLARHFVGDQPPPALVDRLAQSFQRSGGQLPALYQTLVTAPEAWAPQQTKLKTPEEFVISSARLLGLGEALPVRSRDGGIAQMGQRVQAAPSPAGWPDRADQWLGPEAIWKRVEWASRLAGRLGSRVDARHLAGSSLGPLLSGSTAQQIARAADGPQALTLLLMSPEFQRR
ncbi:MAG: DUF1800 domain-containing protein [Burkholderiaceae bacterium]|nr:DUF1800 domain-containing protein [Burkholderiaceae bacterium]